MSLKPHGPANGGNSAPAVHHVVKLVNSHKHKPLGKVSSVTLSGLYLLRIGCANR